MDLFYVAVILTFFALSWALVALCSKLGGES
jgi:hypothetical protein